MKLLAAATIAFFALSQPLLVAQTTENTTQNFSLSQSATNLNLEQKEFETVYETQQVPSTCYNSEVHGSTTQCHTEYDHQCHTNYEQSCNQVPHQVCQTVPRPVCSTQNVCVTTNDQVCHGLPPNQVCQNVPRPVCHSENVCHTIADQVCHTESTTQCHQVPVTSCQDIPHQACEDVPNVVQVPYSCTKPVQVAVGQRLKMDTHAAVSVTLANFSEVGQLSDQFRATLSNGTVNLGLTAPSKAYLYQIVSQDRTEQSISATEKNVNYTVVIKAVSIASLNTTIAQFQNVTITSMKFYGDHVEYTVGGNFPFPLGGNIKAERKNKIAINRDFTAANVTNLNGTSKVAYSGIGAAPLDQEKYTVTLTLKPDLQGASGSLLNPEAAGLVNAASATTSIVMSGYPYLY